MPSWKYICIYNFQAIQAVGPVQNAKWNLTANWKRHSDAGHSSAQTIELKIVSFNDYGSEMKTGSENKWDISLLFWDIFTWKMLAFHHITLQLLENSQKLECPNPFLPIR